VQNWWVGTFNVTIFLCACLITIVNTETDPARAALLFPRHRAQFISHCSIIILRLNATCVGIPASATRPSAQLSFELVFCLPATRAGITTTHDTCHRLRPQAGRMWQKGWVFVVLERVFLGKVGMGFENKSGWSWKVFLCRPW